MTSSAIARAGVYLHALAARAARDPERPQCHFVPPARWMNDPNGTIFYRGWYHLFYQLNPFGDQWGFMHWGHARSRDLIHWEHLPIALAPEVEQGEEHCYSGSIALDHAGQPCLLYTSVGFADTRPFWQCLARPLDDDLCTWERSITQVMPGTMTEQARDPYMFTWQGRTFVILGDAQAVLLYEAIGGDFTRLQARAPLVVIAPGQLDFCECPNFMPVGPDHWVLLMSPFRAVEWRLGTFDGEQFRIEQQGTLDAYDGFYATNTLTDAEGRTVVLGWIRGFPAGRGWNGCLSLPRIIERDSHTGIRQRFHPCLELLRQGAAQSWQGVVTGERILASGLISAAEVMLTASAAFTLRVCGVVIAWNGAELVIESTVVALSLAPVELHLVVDRTVIELFADGGRTAITRVVSVPERDEVAVITAQDAEISSQIFHLCP